jgi:Kef-type K+ transport system membrane component KefB
MLFFFAGYEIDFERIRGTPLRLAVLGWVFSLALAYGLGGILETSGIVLSLVFTGSAMATTAIGTLIPILSDAGEVHTRFGTYMLAAGAAGEFGPILLITLVFSTKGAAANAAILLLFILLAVATAIVAVRGAGLGWPLLERTLETSGQLAIRVAVVLVFALGALASELGLDLLLGGFVAGVIVREALKWREVRVFESKLTAVGYGFFIPFFFVTSGLKFELNALTDDPINLLKLPLFLALFLIVRGAPAMLLYKRVLDRSDRVALALFSATELPLVVAITTIAIDKGEMRASTAASLIGAAILSTAIFPLLGLRQRGGRARAAEPTAQAL